MTDISQEVEKHLKSLSYGAMGGRPTQAYKHHRKLYKMGKGILPYIEEKIFSQPWGKVTYEPQLVYLVSLLNLVHDIDEHRSAVIIQKLKSSGCSDIVNRRISILTTFTRDNFYVIESRGLQIFISKNLGKVMPIQKRICKWLTFIPQEDISALERIYIVPPSESDFKGYYMPILFKILVEWDMPYSYFNPISWTYLSGIKWTFFHEIGHHALRHDFGQDPEQEDQANSYAAKQLIKSHTILFAIFKWIVINFRKIKRSLKRE